ncbi:MAG TPA: transmembrane 220 family protein [Flavitalea sp.]|nr:transmembrane 220 family protein [Flavitalea sp.]
MKVFNLIFTVLFILFAAVQYNDPDPYLWIPLYLFAAAMCWLASRQKFYPKLYLIGIAVYTIYAAFLFFSKDGMLDWMREHESEDIAAEMKATKPWIEATREVLGLVIMIVVLLINYFYSRRKTRSRL